MTKNQTQKPRQNYKMQVFKLQAQLNLLKKKLSQKSQTIQKLEREVANLNEELSELEGS